MNNPQRIMIAAWGSRGDLQPVTALALGLQAAGREVLVFATPPATELLKENGISCIEAREDIGDFVEQMFGSVDLSDRSVKGVLKLARFGKEYLTDPDYVAMQKLDMEAALAAAESFQPDLLITPNIIYGPYMSLAEALQIPVVTYDLQINHITSEYPLFTMRLDQVPRFLNRSLYRFKAWAYLKTMGSKFTLMRTICGLPQDTYSNGTPFKMWPHDLPQICAVSPALCPQPTDWPDEKVMGGWWFLNGGADYAPPPGLVDFLKHRPVYIGFGSMKGNPDFCRTLSTLALKSLQLAGVKGVLLGGWAGLTRDALDVSTEEGQALSAWAQDNVFEIDSCPHDWLFPHCSAVVHHGGAGTLAAGIRAGRPTIVCAMQGDQPFHGSLVEARGIGRYMGMVGSPKLTAENLANGIRQVVDDQAVNSAALNISKTVQAEDGVAFAIRFIDRMAETYPFPWPLKNH